MPSADRPCRADCTAASPWRRWSAATTNSMIAATAQITTSATTAAVIFHRLENRLRPGASLRSGPSGRSALGSPGSPLFTAGSVLR